MIGTYNYLLYTNDTAFLQQNWAGYIRAMNYIYGKVGPSGLLNVTGLRDWARWQTGFNQSEAQMILFRTLNTGSSLAQWVGDTTGLSANWTTRAAALQNATLTYCWDEAYGAFKDNATDTTLHPQDANSMAILFGLVAPDSEKAQSISERLTANWTPIGANSPELPGNISPFISSFEIQAHLTIGQTERALDLTRRCWGWYLNNPNGTGSTVIEGYLINGTFGYRWNRGYDNDFSYPSHSHGWSSGPTSALTEFVLGLSITAPLGSRWQFAPQFGDLGSAEGGFTTSLGKFSASWESAGRLGYLADVSTPVGTSGQLILPATPGAKIILDGKIVCPKPYRTTPTGETVLIDNVAGGKHTIAVAE